MADDAELREVVAWAMFRVGQAGGVWTWDELPETGYSIPPSKGEYRAMADAAIAVLRQRPANPDNPVLTLEAVLAQMLANDELMLEALARQPGTPPGLVDKLERRAQSVGNLWENPREPRKD